MKTSVYRISDICCIKSGKRLPAGTDFSIEPTPYRYIRSRDIKGGKISLEDVAYIDEETKGKIKKYIINSGDIAITIVANIGDIGYATQECDGINLTENAVRLTCFDEKYVYSKYLAYYLRQDSMKSYMEGLSVGAAQAKLGIYKIEKIKLQLPSVDVQKTISGIIEKYEALIEANDKRIKVLEQMAENLYKEWFVRFRFPGHETAEFENGLPKGWRISTLGNEARFINGRAYLMPELQDEGKYRIVRVGNFSGKDEWFYSDMELEEDKYCEQGDLLYKWSCNFGPEIWNEEKVIYHYHIWKVLPGECVNKMYLYYYLAESTQLWSGGTNGTAMAHITKESMEKKKILIPAPKVLNVFEKYTQEYMQQVLFLRRQKENLTNQRDFLLPRLMSGKLEV